MDPATDDEEYRNLVVSMVLHARAILDGQYPFWTSDLGLGMPHPLHPAFLVHPLLPLFGLTSPATALRLVYVLHGALGAWGAWRLARHLGVEAWIAGAGRRHLDTRHACTQLRARRLVAVTFLRLVAPPMDGPVPAPHPRRRGPDATVAPDADPWPGTGALRSQRTLRPGADPRPADGVDVCVRTTQHGSPAAHAADGSGDRHLHSRAGSGAFAAGDPALPRPAPEYRGGANRRTRSGGPRASSLD